MSHINEQFFSNRACPCFPCHPWENGEPFNCMFCYCPLYVLGADCGGGFRYTEAGVKDCSCCRLPHSAGGYHHIQDLLPAVLALASRLRDGEREG